MIRAGIAWGEAGPGLGEVMQPAGDVPSLELLRASLDVLFSNLIQWELPLPVAGEVGAG